MPEFKYVGPYEEVDVPALGAVVKQGETVDVSDEEAAGLEGQSTWQRVKAAKKTESKEG